MALDEVLAARGEASAGAAAHVVGLLEAGSGPQRETITPVLLHIRWQQCIIAPRELKYRRMKLHFEHSVVQVRGNWGYGGASRGAQRPRCSPRRPHPLGEAEAYNRRPPSKHFPQPLTSPLGGCLPTPGWYTSDRGEPRVKLPPTILLMSEAFFIP